MDTTGNTTVLMLGVAGMGLSIAMFLDALKMKKSEEKVVTPIDDVLPLESTPVHEVEQTPLPIETEKVSTEQPETVVEEPEPVLEPVSEPVSEPVVETTETTSLNEEPVVVKSPVQGGLDIIYEESNETDTQKNKSVGSSRTHKSRQSSSSEPVHRNIYDDSLSEPIREVPPVPPNSPVSDQSSNRAKKNKRKHLKHGTATNGKDMTAEERVSYRQFYQNKRNKIIDEYNSKQPDNSYYGDGSPWSKRMYFIKEAYRRSREQTPVKVPYK